MKHFVWCLLLLCHMAWGQTNQDDDYKYISGNPYLFKDWSDGVVRFSSGRTMNLFKLKFDCLKNRLLLQFDGNAFATESKVQEFVLYPKSKKKDSLVFRKGFPPAENTSENTFYQVLFQDKVVLLRLFFRNIIEENQLVTVSTRPSRRLEEAEQFYLFQNGQMILLPAGKNEMAAKFPSRKEELAQFINARQLKMQTAGDFVQLVKKYNELLQ